MSRTVYGKKKLWSFHTERCFSLRRVLSGFLIENQQNSATSRKSLP